MLNCLFLLQETSCNVLQRTAMNVDPAKPPDTARNWEGVDIFLFSNGQQYSPPRKYHLRAEELSWWDSTLNYLARAQYGSLHSSIDLYTTNGRQISGPMELSDGGAYVAVEPPDTFIDAGYEKYLLKATRSWEKRHSKQSSNIEVSKPDDVNITTENTTIDKNIDIASIKTPNQTIRRQTLTTNVAGKDTTISIKSQSPSIKQQSPNVMVHMKKLDQVKEPQRQSILRRNMGNSIAQPVLVKKPLDKRRDSLIKARNLKIAKNVVEKTVEQTPVVAVNSNGDTSKFNEIIKQQKDTLLLSSQNTSNGKVEDIVIEEEICLIRRLSSDTIPLLADKEETATNAAVVAARKNNLGEIQDKTLIKQDNQPKPVKEVPNETVLKGLSATETSTIKSNNESSKISEKVKIAPYTQTSLLSIQKEHNEENVPSKQTPTINKSNIPEEPMPDHLTIVSKGDFINLKLCIEVRNNDPVSDGKNSARQSTYVEATRKKSVYDIFKADKISQVDYDDDVASLCKRNQDIYFKSKSLQSTLQCDTSNNMPRIIVIECACNNLSADTTLPHEKVTIFEDNNKKFIVITPFNRLVDEKVKNSERCTCNLDKATENNENIGYLSTQTFAEASLTRLGKMINVIKKEDISAAASKRNSIVSQDYRKYDNKNQDDPPKFNISINRNQSSMSYESQKSNQVKKNILKAVQKVFVDKSTQTEWCNIMLEARLHEDGHYTLHLPPLQVLRFYKL